jgi:hypothetical protein
VDRLKGLKAAVGYVLCLREGRVERGRQGQKFMSKGGMSRMRTSRVELSVGGGMS